MWFKDFPSIRSAFDDFQRLGQTEFFRSLRFFAAIQQLAKVTMVALAGVVTDWQNTLPVERFCSPNESARVFLVWL